jgi:hypothetical protein
MLRSYTPDDEDADARCGSPIAGGVVGAAMATAGNGVWGTLRSTLLTRNSALQLGQKNARFCILTYKLDLQEKISTCNGYGECNSSPNYQPPRPHVSQTLR